MTTWLDVLKGNTCHIRIDNTKRTITLVHAHWSKGKDRSKYRQLLKLIKLNPYKHYTIYVNGFMSLEGAIILSRLQGYLDKLDIIEYTKLRPNLSLGMYNLEVKFK